MSSWTDPALLGACALIAVLIALPALGAGWRRRRSRELARVANGFMELAQEVRSTGTCLQAHEDLLRTARALEIPELVTFEFIHGSARTTPELLADTAQRLALRLKRRVAFERKMLARTASGRRRGAVAAALPGGLLLMLGMLGVDVAAPALAVLLGLEVGGCWLLWRVARVDI
jgi:hypothetical protein